MAQEIDRKLRLTAAFLGTVTRKDLAAAFRRANPATSFDVDRANKWVQGRASPRELGVYEDWAKVLDLDRSGQWIAECDIEAFLTAICARHGADRDALLRGLRSASDSAGGGERDQALAGTFACYSHAWSPYFRGRLVRGELSIATASGRSRLLVSYVENLPTGRLHLEGSLAVSKRSIHLDLGEPGGEAHFVLFLFPPTLPITVLGGLMSGATVIGPEAQPSSTRIVMARLPAADERLRTAEAYLAPGSSVAEDLIALGLPLAEPAAVDRSVAAFLSGGGNGLDQIPAAAYRALVDVFDRAWLARSGVSSEWPATLRQGVTRLPGGARAKG